MGGHAQDGLPRAPSRIGLVKAAPAVMEAHPRPAHFTWRPSAARCTSSPAEPDSGIPGAPGDGSDDLLRLHRLHGIRQELLRPIQQTKIRAFAAEWGFLNPGHFSRQ